MHEGVLCRPLFCCLFFLSFTFFCSSSLLKDAKSYARPSLARFNEQLIPNVLTAKVFVDHTLFPAFGSQCGIVKAAPA